jgi:glucosamine--fructose-6-phosphate aminotransferase (isomerizing)
MYDAILAQPASLNSVVEDNASQIKELSGLMQQAKTIFLVGTGTSYHAAWAAKFILRANMPKKPIIAQTSIDFALYEETLNAQALVIVFSHRGTKKYSLQSLEKAKSAAATTVLITGQGNKQSDAADLIIETVAQEESAAHTISYTSSLAPIVAAVDGPIEDLANILQGGLALEAKMQEAAAKAQTARRIWIVGGGPNEVTAKEIALKIKETSYTQTEGMGVEELFHGPFQSAQPEDMFILVAPEGKTKERTLELVPAIKEVGASLMIISHGDGENYYEVPKITESYSTLSCIVPLQLFTYHLALAKGTNPDSFRLEDPRFAKAEKYMKL